MKISVEQQLLAGALQIAARVAPTRSTLSLALGVRLQVSGDVLAVAATDSTVYTEIPVPIAGQAQERAIVVPAHQLADLVRRMPPGPIALESDGSSLRVSFGEGAAYRVPVIPGQFFETPTPSDDAVTFKVPSEVLAAAISGTAGFVAPEGQETLSILSGIHLAIGPDGFSVFATDRHRIARYFDPGITHSEHVDFVLTAKSLLDFVKLLPVDAEVDLTVDDRGVYSNVGGRFWSSRLIAGQFPPLGTLLTNFSKTDDTPRVVVDRAELAGAITRLLGINHGEPLIEFQVTGSALIATTEDAGSGSGVERLQADVSGAETAIAFNGRFIAESLKHLDSDQVVFEVIENTAAAGTPHARRMARLSDTAEAKLVYYIAPTMLRAQPAEEPAPEQAAS